MKIVDNSPKTILFDTLNPGDSFKYVEEDWIGIKLAMEVYSKCGDPWNCVDVETGELAYLDKSDYVVHVNAEVVISGGVAKV